MATNDLTAATRHDYPAIAVPRPKIAGALLPNQSRIAATLKAPSVIAAMVLGSLALWTVVPLGVVWLVARLSGGPQSMLLYFAAFVGIIAAMSAGGMALGALERIYLGMTGAETPRSPTPAWRRSVSDSMAKRPASLLEKIMTGTVLVAVCATASWFLLFAPATGLPS
jgi:hypothetical protein